MSYEFHPDGDLFNPPCEGGQGDVPLVWGYRLSHVKVSLVLWNIPRSPFTRGIEIDTFMKRFFRDYQVSYFFANSSNVLPSKRQMAFL